MKNLKKYFLILIIIFFTKTALASIEITEIMYDASGTDTNREWIEVYNNSSEPVDLSKWYFFSDNTKHTLNPNSSSSLQAGAYAVIVQDVNKFLGDWPNFSGIIFDSSWTGLSNENDSISMKDPELNVVGAVSYSSSIGAVGDGNSLQKIGGELISSSPTPGTQNNSSGSNPQKNSSNNNNDTNNNSNQTNQESTNSKSSSSSSAGSTAKVAVEIPRIITTKIIAKNNATTRVGFLIDTNTIGYLKEKLDEGKFVWSFGDGNSLQEAEHKPFEYAYQYAGEYVLSLTYYESILSTKPVASDNIIITVTDPALFITKVGDINDPYVEIKNQSENRMSLSGWVLNSNTKSFKLPEGMAILPNKSIALSPKVTLFDSKDVQNLSLYAPNGSLVSTYPTQKVTKTPNYVKSVSTTRSSTYNDSKPQEGNTEIDLDNLSASAGSKKISDNYLPLVGLAIIILLGIGAVVFAYKKSPHDEGISEISSSDIKIIE
jgi:hypothetical protein